MFGNITYNLGFEKSIKNDKISRNNTYYSLISISDGAYTWGVLSSTSTIKVTSLCVIGF